MPGDKVEVLDDFILDMDIETITLDDMEIKEMQEMQEIIPESEMLNEEIKEGNFNIANAEFKIDSTAFKPEMSQVSPEVTDFVSEQPKGNVLNVPAGNVTINIGSDAIIETNSKMSDQSKEMIANEDITFDNPAEEINQGTLDMIEETPEPELPAEAIEEPSPAMVPSELSPETLSLSEAALMKAEDDIVTVEGNELDKMIYGDEEEKEETEEKQVIMDDSDTIEITPEMQQPVPETRDEKIENVPVIEEKEFEVPVPGTPVKEEEEELVPADNGVETIVLSSGEKLDEMIEAAEENEAFTIIDQPIVHETSFEEPAFDHEEIIPLPEETVFTEEPISMFDDQPVKAEFLAEEETPVESFEMISEVQEEAIPVSEFTPEPAAMEITEKELTIESPHPEEEIKAPEAEAVEAPESSFDLSVIPDVAEIEEDEPIALSMDELNNIDISEGNVVEIATPQEPFGGEEPIYTSEALDNENISSETPEISMEASMPEVLPETEMTPIEFENPEETPSDTIRLVEESEEIMEPIQMEEQKKEKIEVSLDELNEVQKDISEELKVVEVPVVEETPSPVMKPAAASESKEQRKKIIEEKLESLSHDTKDELKSVLSYLDTLLEDLPEDKIKQFAKSDYYDLYVKILDKLGI